MTIKQIGSSLIEEAVNRLLRLDPTALERLGDLDGRVVCLRLRDSSIALYLFPSAAGFRVESDYEGEPDVILTGTPLGFARLSRAGDPSDFAAAGVEMAGDTELGRRLKRVFEHLEIDWEEVAARYTGDVLAHQLGNLVRGGRRWASNAADTLGRDVAEYLQDEQLELAKVEHVEHFLRGVDGVRADADRLAARVALLEQRLYRQ